MADAGIAIGENITGHLVVPALKKFFRPIFCFQTIVDDFQDQSKKLIAIRERVENEMQRDRDNGLIIYDSVEEWVKKVNEDVMPEVQCMLNELLGDNKSCFRYSWCPNWTCHYRFSKQVSKITGTMKTLSEEGNSFSSISHTPTLHQDIIGSSSSTAFIHSRSSKSAFDQILEALKRDDVNLMGLYGKASSGKTTLAEQVGEEAKKLLYRVIMVPVSQHPQVRSIQGFIADFLNLPLDRLESEQGRAAKLQLRLRNGEKILIILDDVGTEFCLDAVVGIPSVGCKILLTASTEIHVSESMHTQKHILLGALSEDEAWYLLKCITGVSDEVRKHDVAKDALEECNGLPKAIVAMGRVLNGKGVLEWRETLQQHNAAKFKIIDSLKEGVKKLRLRQDRVNIKIKMAKQNAEEIYPDVEKWLEDVERVTNDVEQFEDELNQNRWCFDELGVATRVKAMTDSIEDLYAEGNFGQVSHHTPLVQDMEVLPCEDIMFSKAAKSAFDQIMEALRTDGVNMIGLYGMGGIGKTTLAMQVQKEVIRKNICDRVVMVTVSQKPDVGNMQAKIADFLGIELRESSMNGRASKLYMRLKTEKFLIILDDVWKRFDLGTIGVMLNNLQGCKVLLTTRRKDVCISMNSQKDIQLDLFLDEEAQSFFRRKTGLSVESMLNDLAKQTVTECKCLPIALETVGAALKRKDKDEWVEALEKLRNARLVDIIGVDHDEKNVYKCLRVSYDYLNDQPQGPEAQFILLLCSLFPEDYEIEAEDLTRYAFGMKLFEKVESIEDARRKVRVIIRVLKDSCLLLDVGGEEYVKMHDVVRDVLLWIGGTEPQERNTLTVRDGVGLKDLIGKKSFQNCKALSFTSDVIPKFYKYSKLEFPNLEIVLIFIKYDHNSVELGEGFFEHMKLLKVLDFRAEWRWRRCEFAMFQSLHCLEYLRTLMLRNCECSNSYILGDVGRLRILSLHNCVIDCGVEVVSGLKKLRLLDLSGLEAERRMFTYDVIEALVKLEELYGYSFEKCKYEEGTSSRLYELKLPSNLVALSVFIEDVRCLPKDFCFPNLQSYDIHIGIHGDKPSSIRRVRHLELSGDIKDESVMINMCKKLFPTVQVFSLSYCDDLYSLPALSLQALERLEVSECKKMEWVLKVGNVSNNNNSIVQILSLKKLYLYELNIKHIWKGDTRLVSLCNLTKVKIIYCSKLICIFSSPCLATSLQQLKILKIENCHNLEEIFSRRGGSDDDDDDDDDFSCFCCFSNLRELKVSQCDKVKTIFPLMKSTGRAPHLHPQSRPCRLPKLERILLDRNGLLEHIFGHQTQAEEGVECPSLQVLDVTQCPNISTTHIVATQLQASSSEASKDNYSVENIHIVEERLQRRHDDLPQHTIICFSFLNRVKLTDCNNLKQVFTTSLVTSLHLLEVLIIKRCNELEQVIRKLEDGKEEPTIGVYFENMKTLCVSHCGKLKSIFPIYIALPKLEGLKLKSNAELEHVFGRSDWDCTWRFLFLEDLCVKDCPKLCTEFVACIQNPSTTESRKDDYSMDNIQIVEERLKRRRGDLRHPSIVCFSFLNRVELRDCNKLKQVFTTSLVTSLHLLEVLIVKRCDELEQVMGKAEDRKEPTIGVCFENLKILCVSHCGKLKTIFQISIAFPKLEELKLKSNVDLEHVFGQSNRDCTWQCPFLKDLFLKDCPKLCTEFAASIQNPSTAEEIKLAQIQGEDDKEDDDSLTSPFKILSPWNSEEVKCTQRGPTPNICFADLCQIKVIGCHKLKHLFATKIATNFPKLKRLIVRRCNELEEVIMVEDGKKECENDATAEIIGKVGFESLEVLHVSNCKKLKTVFSTFISLPKLDNLLLESNAVLESVFGQSDCDCTSHWPRLNVLSVTGCPKLCTEATAIVKSQSQLQAHKPPSKELSIINLSDIQGVEELIQFRRQDGGDVDQKTQLQRQLLKLEELGDLKRIWSGPTQDISFSFLGALRVIGCSRLKQLFTTTMATSLHNLLMLSVERCYDLEQVIQEDENEDSKIQSVQQLEFPRLRLLRLIDLPKLISFCPASCNLVFTNLREKNLKVKGCSKSVTEFFSELSYQEEEEDKDEYKYGFEVDYDYEGEDGEEDEFEFKDEDKDDTQKFACAILGLRLKD